MNVNRFQSVVLAFLLTTAALQGCSCLSMGPFEPCLRTDAAVFLGEVIRTEPASWDADGSNALAPMWRMLAGMTGSQAVLVSKRTAFLRVVDAYRNVDFSEISLEFRPDDCSVSFEAGQKYLVFARQDRQSGKWTTGVCFGTQAASSAQNTIEHFRRAKTGDSVGRVFGFVTREPRDIQYPWRASKPVTDMAVVLRKGDRVYRTRSDAEGRYEFTGLADGLYSLAAELGGAAEPRSVKLDRDGMCSVQNWLVER